GSKTLSYDVKYKAGNYWILIPNISFAANARISLTGGIQWLGKQPDRIDGKKESARNTATYANFDAGYGFAKTAALNATARFNLTGQSSSELKLGVRHE
ncbi:meta-pathway of phenol degradation family protein, partial [Neisseria gonorrhoeae]